MTTLTSPQREKVVPPVLQHPADYYAITRGDLLFPDQILPKRTESTRSYVSALSPFPHHKTDHLYMLDPDLIHKINLARCFILIGSGPSSEIGYPSWDRLANDVWSEVILANPHADRESFSQFILRKDYPAALRQAEVDLGGRTELIAAIRKVFKSEPCVVAHPIYEYLAKWPFACYLRKR